MAKALVIYTTGNQIHRGYVVPDNDSDLANPAWVAQFVAPGHSSLVVDVAQIVGRHPQDVLIANGISPRVPDRYVVVNPNASSPASAIEQVFIGDPALDAQAFPGKQLIAHASAGPRWTWTAAGGFAAPPEVPPGKKATVP